MSGAGLACPYGDGAFPTVDPWMAHVASHLTEGVPADSPAARVVAEWESAYGSRGPREVLMRLLAVALANRGVIQTVDTGAALAATTAQAAGDAAAQLAALASTYEAQLAASVEDRKTLRADLDSLAARVEALESIAQQSDPQTEQGASA